MQNGNNEWAERENESNTQEAIYGAVTSKSRQTGNRRNQPYTLPQWHSVCTYSASNNKTKTAHPYQHFALEWRQQ